MYVCGQKSTDTSSSRAVPEWCHTVKRLCLMRIAAPSIGYFIHVQATFKLQFVNIRSVNEYAYAQTVNKADYKRQVTRYSFYTTGL